PASALGMIMACRHGFSSWLCALLASSKAAMPPTNAIILRMRSSRSLAGPLQRLRADIGIDHLAEVAGLGDLAELEHLCLHPGELVHRYREVRGDGTDLHRVVVDERRPRVVGLGIGRLCRELDGVVAVRERIAQRLRLRGEIADRILAPRAERLAA